MKTLILTLAILTSPLAKAANHVNVIIDGESYTCGNGNNSSGNQCECLVQAYGGGWRWDAYKKGSSLGSNYTYNTQESAKNACDIWTKTNTSCCQ